MNKLLVAISVFALNISANASVMKPINKATDPALNAIYKAIAPTWNKSGNCVETRLVKVLKPTEARGRNPEQLMQAMISESIHKYVTAWFDDGINISRVKSKKEFLDFMSSNAFGSSSEDESLKIEQVTKAIIQLGSNKSIAIYTGSASGNNTMGEVVGIVDLKNKEILSLVNSNFASDDSCGD